MIKPLKSFIKEKILKQKGIELSPVESYDLATQVLASDSEYRNGVITDYVIASSLAYLEITKNKITKSGALQNWEFNMLNHFKYFSQNKSSLKVLDFGGGLVPLYWHIIKLLPEFSMQWGVWELEDLVEKSKEFRNDNISFYTSPQSCKDVWGDVDVVFSRNSLQYCPEPIDFLEMLLKVEPEYILFKKLGVIKSGKKRVFMQGSNLLDHGPVILEDYDNIRVEYPVTYCPIEDYLKVLVGNGYSANYHYEEEGSEFGSMVTLIAEKSKT